MADLLVWKFSLTYVLFFLFLFYQCESNARFVKWSDGSLQLLIGNEVLDISVQNAHHDQSQLFINSGKVCCNCALGHAFLFKVFKYKIRKVVQSCISCLCLIHTGDLAISRKVTTEDEVYAIVIVIKVTSSSNSYCRFTK